MDVAVVLGDVVRAVVKHRGVAARASALSRFICFGVAGNRPGKSGRGGNSPASPAGLAGSHLVHASAEPTCGTGEAKGQRQEANVAASGAGTAHGSERIVTEQDSYRVSRSHFSLW